MTRLTNRLRSSIAITVAVLAASVTGTAILAGHAVVFPRTSAPGAYERYLLRVPNERPVPTREVRIYFPAELRVVSLGEVPGWRLTVHRDSAGLITGATWTGEIGVERFAEFPFVGVNPQGDARLVWRASQVYASGEQVDWFGPEDSATPASVTVVAPASGANGNLALVLAAVALVLSFAAVTVALRRR